MNCHQIAGHSLPYDELDEIRDRLSEISPTLVQYGVLEPANFYSLANKLSEVFTFACVLRLMIRIIIWIML